MKPTIKLILLLAVTGHGFGQEVESPARAWTNNDGKTIFAPFIKADAETVTISIKGRPVVVKLADLSEQSQRLAAELQGDPEPKPEEPEPKPEEPAPEAPAEETMLEKEHQWKNTAGKIITAKYLRSDNVNVILSMGGRKVPYALTKLSPESIKLVVALRKMSEPGYAPEEENPKKPTIDLKAEREWTNAAGKTLRGVFVSADAENVTLLIGRREYPMPLASLSKDSQKLALQLGKAWADSQPKIIQGKGNRMAYYGNGDWRYYNTVFQSANFDAALHYNGRSMHVWFKDRGSGRGATDGARIGSGRPIAMNFNMHYYDRTDPKRVRHRTRKVVSIEREWEVTDNFDEGIRTVRGTLDNNGTFEVGFDFTHKTLGIWGKVNDLSSEKWPTRIHVGVRVPKCINWTDEMRAKDWDPLLGDAAIHITPVEGKQARLPLNVKWLELNKQYGHTNPAKGALVFGKPWGAFKLRVTPRTTRDASFRWGKGYTGVFPFQGFYFGYYMAGFDEIPRAKRLDLIVYR